MEHQLHSAAVQMKSQQRPLRRSKCISLRCFWFDIQNGILINYHITLYNILFLNIQRFFFNLENKASIEMVKVNPKISILALMFYLKIMHCSVNKHFLNDVIKFLGTNQCRNNVSTSVSFAYCYHYITYHNWLTHSRCSVSISKVY